MALTDAEQRELDELEYKTLMAKHRGDPETAALLESSAVSEGPANVPAVDRMLIQNLSNSPQAGAEYLKQQGYDAKVYGSEIVIKDKATGKIQQLDPNDLEWKDATDILYDVPAGAVQGVSTAFGGVYGGIPGASAASGASGMVLEALRQKLGQYAGLPQDVNAEQVGIAGLAGIASPALLGSGATTNQIAKRAAAKGISEAELANANRSLVTRGVEKALPKVAATLSGVPEEDILTYWNRRPEVKMAGTDSADAVYKNINTGLENSRVRAEGELMNQYPISVNQELTPVDYQGVHSQIGDAKITLDNTIARTKAYRDEALSGIKDSADSTLSEQAAAIRAKNMETLQNNLGTEHIDDGLQASINEAHSAMKENFFAQKQAVGEKIGNAVANGKGTTDPQKLFKPFDALLADLRRTNAPADDIAAMEAEIATVKRNFSQPSSIDTYMYGPQQKKMTAQDIFNLQDTLKGNSNVFNIKDGFQSRYPKASSGLMKKWSDANLKVYQAGNKELDTLAGTQGFKDEYKNLIRIQDGLERNFSTPEQMYKTISTIDKPQSLFTRNQADEISALTGGKVNLYEISNNIKLHSAMSLPDEKLVNRTLLNKLNEPYKIQAKALAGQTDSELAKLQALKTKLNQLHPDVSGTEKTLAAGKFSPETDAYLKSQGIDIGSVRQAQSQFASTQQKNAELQAANEANDKLMKKILSGTVPQELPTPEVAKYLQAQQTLGPKFSSGEKTYQTLIGIGAPSKEYTRKAIGDAEDLIGKRGSVEDAAKLMRSARSFNDAGYLPVSGGKTTSTSRSSLASTIGAGAGAAIAGIPGAAAGAALAPALVGPAAVKKYMDAGLMIKGFGQYLPEGTGQLPAQFSPWVQRGIEEQYQDYLLNKNKGQ